LPSFYYNKHTKTQKLLQKSQTNCKTKFGVSEKSMKYLSTFLRPFYNQSGVICSTKLKKCARQISEHGWCTTF
jgi:hypothetical protein